MNTPEEDFRYSSTLPLTSMLYGGRWSAPSPIPLPCVTIVQEAVWNPGPVRTCVENLAVYWDRIPEKLSP
jgi:hypothetical protein